jgi:hypothetical protein
MKRITVACLLLMTGCSSAPVADFMDHFFPGRLPAAPGYHGGVGAQQQAVSPAIGPESPQPPPPASP